MSTNPVTKAAIKQLRASIAQVYNVSVEDTTDGFAIEPSIEQRLEAKITENVDFLGLINVAPVDELLGQVLGLFAEAMIGSTIGNTETRRSPRDVSGLDDRQFQLFEQLFDTMMAWKKLDTWAKFPNFAKIYSDAVATSLGLTRLSIGFNGNSYAATSDRMVNPLGQDLNIGWLQKLRLERPDHVMGRALAGPVGSQTATGAAVPVRFGPAQTYKNIDAIAKDLISGLPSWARKSKDIVVLVGQDLLDDKHMKQINRPLAAALDGGASIADDVISRVLEAQEQVGGRRALSPPKFPENTILVTPLKNLSLYYQSGGRRRYIRDEPEYRRGLVDYNSSNEGYVLENTDYIAMAETITFTP